MAKKQSIGIEITDGRVDIISLTKTAKKLIITQAISQEVPSYKTAYPAFKESVKQLVELFPELKEKRNKVIIGLPRREVFFRLITIPTVDEADLRQVLEFEIERHIPFPAEEVYFDFQVNRQDKEATTVLVIVIRRELLNQIQEAFTEALISCHIIDISSFAVYGLLDYYYQKQHKQQESCANLLTIEMWPKGVEFNLVVEGKLTNSREIPHNLTPITPHLISLEDEEEQKTQRINQQRLVNQIAAEIETISFDLYNSQENNTSSHQQRGIFLFGQQDLCTVVEELIQEHFHQQATHFNPVENLQIKKPDNLEISQEHSSAIGLALRGLVSFPLQLNLLPPDANQKSRNIERHIMILLGAVILVLGAINLTNRFSEQKQIYQQINQELIKTKPLAQKASDLQRSYKKLKEKDQIIKEIIAGKLSVLNLLKELTEVLPDDAWLTTMQINKNEVEISGYALVALTLIPGLENSDFFEKVQFTSTITTKEEKKERFKIKALIEGKELLSQSKKRKKKRKKRKKRR